jgi:carbonic anhydrase
MISLTHLVQGYQRFKKNYIGDNHHLFQELAKGQKPQVMVLACCDSRVDPALLLQSKPGDLFVARSIANFVMPFNKENEVYQGLGAALEFGVRQLEVSHLIILGHSRCGGIEAFLNPHQVLSNNDFISRWLNLITVPETAKKDSEHCAKAALLQSYHNCLSFPWIKVRVDSGLLVIHLWFFDIQTGSLQAYQFNKQCFEPLD